MNSSTKDWLFIVNPAAKRGLASNRWQRVLPKLKKLLPNMEWVESSTDISLSTLSFEAISKGRKYIVGVGGDGTHHHIINGIVKAGGLQKGVVYAPFALGSGNDWMRTLRVPKDFRKWMDCLVKGHTMQHTVGMINWQDAACKPHQSCFINVAGMAYDAEVVRRIESSGLKHRWLYPVAVIGLLKKYKAPIVQVQTEKGPMFTGAVHTINVGICKYSGGGMCLVPQADPTKNSLGLTLVHKLSVLRILLESWRFYTDTIGQVNGVALTHVQSVDAKALEGTLEVEADGEWLGYGPVRFERIPEKLSVVVPA